jgi:hypothetical protein
MRAVAIAVGILLTLIAQSVRSQTAGRQRRQERRQEAAEEYPDLSLRIVNPLARILTLPTTLESREGAGPTGDGRSFAIRMAPRIPFVLNEDWHLISRIDVAWVSQENVAGTGRQEGLTDLGLTMFLSPDRSLGWDTYWGLGPAIVVPTATGDFLGAEKFSVGPSFAFFRQKAPWTAGIQFTHLWSVAGTEGARAVNVSVIRPLISYTAPTATTIALGAEFRHDWQRDVWVGPLELSLRQLTMIRGQPVHWSLGFQYFVLADDHSPEWGVLFRVTLPIESPRWGRRIAGLESAN